MRVAPIQSSDVPPELIDAYARECGNSLIGEAKPDWTMYRNLEASGLFFVYGLFDEEDMIGFGSVIWSTLPHYGKPVASVESLFVDGQYRGTLGASLLLYELEKQAARVGCKAILYSAPAGGPLEAVLGKRYTRTNSVFCKALAIQP